MTLPEAAINYQTKVNKYVSDVMDVTKSACEWEKRAVERYLYDLEHYVVEGETRFDPESAAHAIRLIQTLKHSKGEWAGQTFTLSPWQLFATWNIFGWQVYDTKTSRWIRRFKTVYIEVPRKNGKTTWMAAVGLYLAFAEGEQGAEVYSAATKRDQAIISHSEATRMVRSSKALKEIVRVFKNNLSSIITNSKFEPLGANADSLDGLNIHAALVDELHAHKSRDLWDVLETATGSRLQPLQWAITTAGFDRLSICFEQHMYLKKILDRVIEDETYFGMIFTIDQWKDEDGVDHEDEWEDEATWIKANPNWGISVKPEDIKRKAKRAAEMPSALNGFLRLHLNKWTEAETVWLSIKKWRQCGEYQVDMEKLKGRECYAGLDLSSTLDISALVLVFPPQTHDDPYILLPRFFIPKDNMHERVKRDRVPYDVWERQGYLTATVGNVIDYTFIMHQIQQDIDTYYMKELAFDRWGSGKIIQDLQELGFEDESANHYQERTLVKMGQGFQSMAHPTREFEKLVNEGNIAHMNNPVLTWIASNVVIKLDPANNMKPDKSKSIEKIDGIVASLMGVDRAIKGYGITAGFTVV